MTDVRVLFVTIPPDRADAFVETLCRERLVACGNVVSNVRSRYWWQGELCSDDEAVLLMETAADRLEAAMQRITALHPYEVPKIVAFAPSGVNEPYARWVVEQTRPQN